MSSPKPTLRACGLYAAVGAFTRGVLDAGYSVSDVLTDGVEGVASHALNFKSVKVHTKPEAWPLKSVTGKMDLIYSQPKPPNPRKPNWTATNAALATALKLKPKVFLLELGSFTYESKELAEWAERWGDAGYQSSRLLINTASFGLPQLRRRTVFVAAQASLDFRLDFTSPTLPPPAPTVWDAISDLMTQPLGVGPQSQPRYVSEPQHEFQAWCRKNVGRYGPTWHVNSPGSSSIESLIPHIPPGDHVGKISDEIYRQTYWKDRKKNARKKPSYFYRRLHWSRPSPTVPGDIRFVHPEIDRFITAREAARLNGIPDDFAFSGTSVSRANLEAGHSVSPHTMQSILAQLTVFLKSPDDREHQPFANLSAVPVME